MSRHAGWTGRFAAALVSLLLLVPAHGIASGRGAVRKQVEASMLVTGMITVRSDGSVAAVDLDKPDKLPDGIAAFVGRSTADWRFEPVLIDGSPANVRTRMSVRLVAKQAEGGGTLVSIRSADFGDYEATPEAERVTGRKMSPPGYPPQAAESGVQGTVYLLLKIGRDGTVGDVVAEQVNLRALGNEAQMNMFRHQLARTSIAAAKRWTFNPPTQGEAAGAPHWVVRVPVDYLFPGVQRRYGQWEAYVPGPRTSAPWVRDDPAFSPDALAEGGIYLAGGNGPKLLTPLGDDA